MILIFISTKKIKMNQEFVEAIDENNFEKIIFILFMIMILLKKDQIFMSIS